MRNAAGRLTRRFRLRTEPRFTQAALAHALQLRGMRIDRAGVSKIEGGYRRLTDGEIVVIADDLGVTPGQLLPPLSDRETRRIIKLIFNPLSDSSE